MPDDRALVAEQIAYYRACATEYDQWWLHLGNRGLSTGFGRRWTAELEQLLDAIDDFKPEGRVLEIAGGTGNFTRIITRYATSITVVDSSPQALAINKEKLGTAASKVDLQIGDIFKWSPSGTYDVVFFSFWLSHVPDNAFKPFWLTVRQALDPGGRVFFLDNLVPLDTAADEIRRETGTPQEFAIPHTSDHIAEGVSIRELSDGRRFRVVKRFWTPSALVGALRELGWTANIRTTDRAFLYGTATPLDRGQEPPA